MKRNTKIKKLRQEKIKLKDIGDKYGITSERVRQIVTEKKRNLCLEHKTIFIDECWICRVKENYQKVIEQMQKERIYDDIIRLSKHDRRKETVVERSLLIKQLVNRYKLPLYIIGRLLDRDHTSIKGLYIKKI